MRIEKFLKKAEDYRNDHGTGVLHLRRFMQRNKIHYIDSKDLDKLEKIFEVPELEPEKEEKFMDCLNCGKKRVLTASGDDYCKRCQEKKFREYDYNNCIT
jgi:hypothetical protein